jgi:hypothetical protein
VPLNGVWRERDTLAGVVESFPSQYDSVRVNQYAEHRMLRHGHHENVFPRVQRILDQGTLTAERQKWAGMTYLPANVCGLLSKAQADDLMLEPPTISFGDDDSARAAQERWNLIAERSCAHTMLLDEVDGGSVNGDAAFKVYRRDDGAVIDAVDVSLVFRGEDYFPEYAAANRDKRITRFPFVASPVRGPEPDEWFVLLELHEPGLVLHRAFRWVVPTKHGEAPSFADDGELTYAVEPASLGLDVEDYATGVADPTLVIVHNERGEHAFWGASDYTREAKALQDAINYQLSQLVEHGERLIAGGIVILPEEMRALVNPQDMNAALAVGKDYGRRNLTGGSVPTVSRRMLDIVFEHAGNKDVTRYVAETPQYEGAMKLLEGLWSAFENLTGMTLDPLFEQEAAPESGRAMRLKRYRDQRRIARKQVRWTDGVQRLAPLALAMDGMAVSVRPSVQWSDSIKLSELEKAEILTARCAGKQTLSVETGIRRMDGLTREQAEQEAKLIDDDAAMQQRQVPRLFSEASAFPDETERPPGGGE